MASTSLESREEMVAPSEKEDKDPVVISPMLVAGDKGAGLAPLAKVKLPHKHN